MRAHTKSTVRFLDLEWLPCPERDDVVGQCVRGGRVALIPEGAYEHAHDGVVHVVVQSGDYLLVADGSSHDGERPLLEPRGWQRTIRVSLPAGAYGRVHFGEPAATRLDEVTGLTRASFGPGEDDVRVDVRGPDDQVITSAFVPRGASLSVEAGAEVRRGDLLARFASFGPTVAFGGIDALRAFLDARVCFGSSAAIAPCDAIVEEVARTHFALKAKDGAFVQVRRRPRTHATVREGDLVESGDALEDGPRSHARLLRVWGPQRLAHHIHGELVVESRARNLAIPNQYWSLVVRAMLDWVRVTVPGDTHLRRHRVISRVAYELARREALAQGLAPPAGVPALRGLASMARAKLREARPISATRP